MALRQSVLQNLDVGFISYSQAAPAQCQRGNCLAAPIETIAGDNLGKENRPPAAVMSQKQHVQKSGSKPATSQARNSRQLFLDLGQKDFSASKCTVCGMVYAKGHEEDEKLHKSFHQTAVQGLKFQGWAQERVVLLEPFTGRLLMVLPSDPVQHIKKVQEVCAFVEQAHGLAPGWLMAAPQCRVFLYVSLQKRVVGVVVAEPIKQAYRVAAPGIKDEEADSSEPNVPHHHQQQQRAAERSSQPHISTAGPTVSSAPSSIVTNQPHQHATVAMAGSGKPTTQQKQQQQQQPQQRPLLWPGLYRSSKRSRLQALLPGGKGAAGSETQTATRSHAGVECSLLLGSHVSVGAYRATAVSEGDSLAVKADSCPPSLLVAAEMLQVNSSTVADAEVRPAAAAVAATTAVESVSAATAADHLQEAFPVQTAVKAAVAHLEVVFPINAAGQQAADVAAQDLEMQQEQQQTQLQQHQHCMEQNQQQQHTSRSQQLQQQLPIAQACADLHDHICLQSSSKQQAAVKPPTQTYQQQPEQSLPLPAQQPQQAHQQQRQEDLQHNSACALQQQNHQEQQQQRQRYPWIGGVLGCRTNCGANSSSAIQGSSKLAQSGGCGSGQMNNIGAIPSAAAGGSSHDRGGSSGIIGGSGRSKSGPAGDSVAAAAGQCMVADKRRAVRAMLGVRMVWVSSEQRRKGLATKLLDAVRCNMVPGYVVPRNQVAVTQPTEEGAKLAAAFTGTQQFMVYGIE